MLTFELDQELNDLRMKVIENKLTIHEFERALQIVKELEERRYDVYTKGSYRSVVRRP